MRCSSVLKLGRCKITGFVESLCEVLGHYQVSPICNSLENQRILIKLGRLLNSFKVKKHAKFDQNSITL